MSLTAPWSFFCVWVRTWHEGIPIAEKEYDTRSWKWHPKPQSTFIHTAKNFPKWAKDLCRENPHFRRVLSAHGYDDPETLPLGVINGQVQILGSLATQDVRDRLSPQELAFGNYDDGRIAIRLANPLSFDNYFHVKGALGLWEVPTETCRTIEGYLGEETLKAKGSG